MADDLPEVVVLGTIAEETIALSVSEADAQARFAPPVISELGRIADTDHGDGGENLDHTNDRTQQSK